MCSWSATATGDETGGVDSVPRRNIVSLEKAAAARQIRERIGQQLKAQYYDLAEPIPDHLAALLKQLAQRMDEGENKADIAESDRQNVT